MKRLIEIQKELKAPKGQYNSFGKYKYRNCEDILEAVKPLLSKHGLALIISDEVISIDGGFEIDEITKDEKTNKENKKHIVAANRVYVKATATIYDNEGKQIAQSSALAREEETKKGMDYSQLTGATSSYARKYALNGLFAIDDTKDSDTTNKGEQKEEPKEPEINENDLDIIEGLKGMDCKENAHKYFKTYEKEVSDIAAFKKAYASVYTKLPTLEELQATGGTNGRGF